MERIRIEKIVHGGFGLGRAAGCVWLVPYTAPGDEIEARAVRQHASYVEGVCERVLRPGEDRIEPPCPVFGQCGGCHLQHLSEAGQVKARLGILLDCLERFGPPIDVTPKVVTGNPWEYRWRLEFHIAASRVGFFERASHNLVEVEDCLIAAPEIRRIISELGRAIGESRVRGPANIEALLGNDGLIVLVGDGPPGWFTPELPQRLLNLEGVKGLVLHARGRHWLKIGQGEVPFVVETPKGRRLTIDLDPRAFSQANARLNGRLVEEVVRLAEVRPNTRVLELYAGSGNFTLPLLDACESVHVTAVEVSRTAVEALEKAARGAGFEGERLRAIVGKTEVILRGLVQERQRFEVVVADPPRGGIGDAVRMIPKFGPLSVVLVSCEPATLARDARFLAEAGYRADALVFVDMFPQTAQVEAVLRMRAS